MLEKARGQNCLFMGDLSKALVSPCQRADLQLGVIDSYHSCSGRWFEGDGGISQQGASHS